VYSLPLQEVDVLVGGSERRQLEKGTSWGRMEKEVTLRYAASIHIKPCKTKK
jgi:hypothetical protein